MRTRSAAIGSAIWFLLSAGVFGGLVPGWLTGWRFEQPLPATWAWLMPPFRVVGAVLIVAGVAAVVDAFARFVAVGSGTPSPVAPPVRLVVSGLYRYVRNPMYVATLAIVIGQALLFGQVVLVGYAAVVWLVTAAFVYGYEQPTLARRFGADYQAYLRAVPAWWPRLHPWRPPR